MGIERHRPEPLELGKPPSEKEVFNSLADEALQLARGKRGTEFSALLAVVQRRGGPKAHQQYVIRRVEPIMKKRLAAEDERQAKANMNGETH